MMPRYTIISDPRFQYLAFVLAVLYLGSFVWNLNHGGIIEAIITVSTSLFGLALAFIFVGIIFVKI